MPGKMRKAPKRASKRARQKVASANIREFHKGARYKSMVRKYGKQKANTIAVAAGLTASRGGTKRSARKAARRRGRIR